MTANKIGSSIKYMENMSQKYYFTFFQNIFISVCEIPSVISKEFKAFLIKRLIFSWKELNFVDNVDIFKEAVRILKDILKLWSIILCVPL